MSSLSMSGQFYQNDQFILQEKDKQLHFAAGVVVSFISYEWALKTWEDKNKAVAFSIGMGILAGVAKETIDHQSPPNRFDDRDVLATTMGSVSISIPLFVFRKKHKRRKPK